MSIASCTSPPPSTRTLPASRPTSSDSSALRAVRIAPTAATTSARSGTGRRAHARCASAALATASSTSASAVLRELGDHLRRPGGVGRAERRHRAPQIFLAAMAVAALDEPYHPLHARPGHPHRPARGDALPRAAACRRGRAGRSLGGGLRHGGHRGRARRHERRHRRPPGRSPRLRGLGRAPGRCPGPDRPTPASRHRAHPRARGGDDVLAATAAREADNVHHTLGGRRCLRLPAGRRPPRRSEADDPGGGRLGPGRDRGDARRRPRPPAARRRARRSALRPGSPPRWPTSAGATWSSPSICVATSAGWWRRRGPPRPGARS